MRNVACKLRLVRRLAWLFATLLLLLGSPALADYASIPDLVADVRHSIALVRIPSGLGTAFVFDARGYLLTNCHMVTKADGEVLKSVCTWTRTTSCCSGPSLPHSRGKSE
jgi:S1-C subfamily serine protease